MKWTKDHTAVIGIDHGYGNIKTANTVTQTGLLSSASPPTFEGNILLYDSSYYTLGEGHKAFIPDKTRDNDFFIFTLMGIAKELRRENLTEADVYLAVGLPLTWVRAQRDTFRAYLTAKEQVSFLFNGTEYRIRIVGCKVYPQGYASVMDRLPEMTGVNMLADIGNGTLNIMYLENRKALESKCWTEKLGTEQCAIRLSNAALDRFGKPLYPGLVQSLLRTGTADIAQSYLDVLQPILRSYCDEVFAALRKYEYDPDMMHLYISGGGSRVIEHSGSYDPARVTLITDICAAAKGYEYLAVKQIGRKRDG